MGDNLQPKTSDNRWFICVWTQVDQNVSGQNSKQAINLSPPQAPELLEGFSFSARGTRVNRPWHIGSEIITALYNRFYRKNKFYFPLLSSSWLNIGETWRKIIERSKCCINFCQSVWRNKSWYISYNTRVVSWPIIKFRVMYFERSGWEFYFSRFDFLHFCLQFSLVATKFNHE